MNWKGKPLIARAAAPTFQCRTPWTKNTKINENALK